MRLTVTDTQGLQQLQELYEPARQVLADILNIKVEFVPVKSHLDAVPAMLADRLDLALSGPSEYLILQARANAVPIVSITRPTYYSVIVVRRDSNLRSIRDLKGKKVSIGPIGSTSQHIYPCKLFLDVGLKLQSDLIPVISQDIFNKEGLEALIQGEVDAWVISNNLYFSIVREVGVSPRTLSIIAKSERIPGDVLVANLQLGSRFVETMRSRILENKDLFLQALQSSSEKMKYGNSQILPAKDEDYNDLRETYKSLGQEYLIQ
ncbi:phosphate/phosphite/phosphonate ABC transporter substrate-binding protein [Baaleninema sp.]|uniref:phosphate/phosphite/phosphonate ABC transporter substrate-binding protein n=1 Tax=Baaleninema sp. TaxID=3101197 RepID=UPI003D052355